MRTRLVVLGGCAAPERHLGLIFTVSLHGRDISGPHVGYAVPYHARRTVHELKLPVATGSYIAEPSLM